MESSHRIYPPREVERITTLSPTTIWRRVKDGEFPAPVQLSPGRIGWLAASVDEWIEKKFGLKPSEPEPDAAATDDVSKAVRAKTPAKSNKAEAA